MAPRSLLTYADVVRSCQRAVWSVLSLAACASNQAATPLARVSDQAGATNTERSLEEVRASLCENNPAPIEALPFSPSLPPLPVLSPEDQKQMPSWLAKLQIGPWNGEK